MTLCNGAMLSLAKQTNFSSNFLEDKFTGCKQKNQRLDFYIDI